LVLLDQKDQLGQVECLDFLDWMVKRGRGENLENKGSLDYPENLDLMEQEGLKVIWVNLDLLVEMV